MSSVEDLKVEMNITETNTTDEREDVFVTKDESFHLAKHEEIKNWTDNNVLGKSRMRDRSVFPPDGCAFSMTHIHRTNTQSMTCG